MVQAVEIVPWRFSQGMSRCTARVAELVDARDLKSLGTWFCTGSIPVPGTNKKGRHLGAGLFLQAESFHE